MNKIMENILTRRSVRAFTDKKIDIDIVKELIKAGLYAPSGMGRQTWKFTAVLNQSQIKKLAFAIGKELKREGYDFYSPSVIIIPSNDKESKFGKEDNACALENIFLAAHSYGIGSVWINQLQNICDVPEIRDILTELEIPENHVVYGLAALGYAKDENLSDVEKIGIYNIIE